MKLMNYDKKDLVYQNVHDIREVSEVPQNYTQTQIKILRRLIQQKKITEQFFSLILTSLFEITDWKQLNYEQMYELIHVLTFWDDRQY